MLTSLNIKGFRCFETLAVDPLARVNLFVGKNNAGKTCLLDAVQILAVPDRIGTLLSSPLRRGELARGTSESASPEPDLRHLFRHRQVGDHTAFTLEGQDDKGGRPRVQALFSMGDMPSKQVRNLAAQGMRDYHPIPLAHIGSARQGLLLTKSFAPLEWPPDDPRLREPRFLRGSWAVDASAELTSLWENLVLQPEEALATSAMQIIDQSVQRIALVQGAFHVKLGDAPDRVPLGSLGEGVQRLLALACYLASSQSQVLLIDDIDTGLHHSVFEKVWRLVVETAQRLDVQVFATTHSLDAVHALGLLCEQEPDFKPLVTVHRVEQGIDHTVAYTSDELAVAAKHHLEVR